MVLVLFQRGKDFLTCVTIMAVWPVKSLCVIYQSSLVPGLEAALNTVMEYRSHAASDLVVKCTIVRVNIITGDAVAYLVRSNMALERVVILTVYLTNMTNVFDSHSVIPHVWDLEIFR